MSASRPSSDRIDVGKNIGIVVGCIAFLVLMLLLLARIWRRLPPDANSHDDTELATVTRHINPADFMRFCALRESRRVEEKQKRFLSISQLDLVAPKDSYRNLMPQQEVPIKAALTSPPPVLVVPSNRSTASKFITEELCPDVSYSESNDPRPICSICLGGYREDEEIRQTRCHHVFHNHCLERWLTGYRARCPLCQKDLRFNEQGC